MTERDALSLAQELARGFQAILGPALTGVYLHGSLAAGAFGPGSDIDFLAVTRRPLTAPEKLELLALLWSSRPRWPEKGVEMSVVTQSAAANPVAACPYELHFSPAWFDRYAANPAALCGPEPKLDRDLPAHFTVTRARGVALLPGTPPPKEVFAPVPLSVYLEAVWYDLYPCESACAADPASAVLNYCRSLAYGATAQVLSKAEGGRWALADGALSAPQAATVAAALSDYGLPAVSRTLPTAQALAFCRSLLPRLPRPLPPTPALVSTPPLFTRRLALRRFTPADAPALYTGWANSEAVCRWLLRRPGLTLAQCQSYLEEVVQDYTRRPAINRWAVCLDGDCIGSISLYLNMPQLAGTASYLLRENMWGRGLATESLTAVMAWGFDALGLERIDADHFAENPASGRVMEKAGMKREGVSRHKYFEHGIFHDAVQWAALREDFEGRPGAEKPQPSAY